MGEGTPARWAREGSLQRQFNFGHVYFEVPVSHICFFLFSSPSLLRSRTSSRAAAGKGPPRLPTSPTSILATEQPTTCLAPFLSQRSQQVFSSLTPRCSQFLRGNAERILEEGISENILTKRNNYSCLFLLIIVLAQDRKSPGLL